MAGASLPSDMVGSSVQVPPPAAPGRRKLSWPETVAGKIEEGQYKVRRMERQKADLDREIEALEKVVEGMESEMQYELDLTAHCSDLEMMRRARQLARPGRPLSDVEERALRDIRDLATSAVADYAASIGPEPAYDRPINPSSDTFRLPLPRAMVEMSASRQSKWSGLLISPIIAEVEEHVRVDAVKILALHPLPANFLLLPAMFLSALEVDLGLPPAMILRALKDGLILPPLSLSDDLVNVLRLLLLAVIVTFSSFLIGSLAMHDGIDAPVPSSGRNDDRDDERD
ncbi:hypothetical protein BAE44_0006151 [Dichanthelium oligosanthes]|uniref:Uncharacterized protein n=1 Tax=Dichanthelium oligosanthes TaxID=888268 RepID=A0A1E5W6H6_9POAL|nr:hypothetical protein BAE44_0006151 [Dichanthelium oligosanthes]